MLVFWVLFHERYLAWWWWGCGLNCVPPPKFICSSVNPQHLRMWPDVEIGLGCCRCNWLRWGRTGLLIHYDKHPYKKFGCRDRLPGRMLCEHCSSAATSQGTTRSWEKDLEQTFPSAFRRNMALWHPDFGRLASRTLRQNVSVALKHAVSGTLLWQP